MKKKLRVELTESAARDAEAAYLWIAERAPEAADRWFNELDRRIASLDSMPARCPVAPEDAAFDRKVRHLLFGNYRIIFTVRADTVFVLHLRHAARLPLPPDQVAEPEKLE